MRIKLLAGFALVSTLLFSVVHADTFEGDGDGALPLSGNPVNFGNVCAGSTQTQSVLLAVKRTGAAGSPNVFKDSSSVTVTVLTVAGAGLSSSITDSTIAIPSNWGSMPNNTLTSDTGVSSNPTAAANVVLVAPLTLGPISGYSVKYQASGINSSNQALDRDTPSIAVNATVVACDTTPPAVVSIVRTNPSPTNAAAVAWDVTFSEAVTGVDATDFALAPVGLSGAPSITSVTGSGSSYSVTASTGAGSGTLGLNLVDNDSIQDAAGNKLGGSGAGNGDFTGQVYTIDKTAPASSISFPINGAKLNLAAYNAGCGTPAVGDLCGTAADSGGSAVQTVEVSIKRLTDNAYWNGAAWAAGPEVFNVATGTTSWSFGLSATNLTNGVSYLVHARATDALGNVEASPTATFTYDTSPPVLALPANMTIEATGPSGAVVTFAASATDAVDGSVPVICSPASGSTFPIGTTTVNCSASDAAGNTGNDSFTVTVQDTTPPNLSLPSNITAEATGPSGAAVSFTATASDLVDGSVAVICSPASGSTFPLGSTTVNCSATDAHSNTANGSFTVTVQDTTPPNLSLPSNITAEATGPSGAAVSFTATASDLVDGSVAVICSPASGSTFPLGSTTVNCSATDAHSNTANGSFTVTVQDTTPPNLSLPSNVTAEATGPSGAAVSFTAMASDLVDGSVAVICSPASGSTFPLGSTTVNCSATDAHSNTANGSFTVTVQDTTPPAVNCGADLTAEATGPAGAAVSWGSDASKCSASDAVGVVSGPTCLPASGSTFAIGTTTVTCSASDAAGNTANDSFTVTVQDTTPPALSGCPSAINVIAPGPSGSIVTYTPCTATDLVDPSPTTECSPLSGSTFPIGTTTVACTFTDDAGNSSTHSFTVSVLYDFQGFFSPVDNPPTFNVVKAGQAVPIKFSLGGNMGLSIFWAGYPKSSPASCATWAGESTVEETVNAGGSSLSYDPVANQYVYVWKTEKGWAGTCRLLIVRLADGTWHYAYFKFK